METDPNFVEKLIFLDEAIFYLNGHVNRQNVRLWCDRNPECYEELNSLDDPRVMVLAGIWNNQVIGPFYFPNTVTGNSFVELIENQVLNCFNLLQLVLISVLVSN